MHAAARHRLAASGQEEDAPSSKAAYGSQHQQVAAAVAMPAQGSNLSRKSPYTTTGTLKLFPGERGPRLHHEKRDMARIVLDAKLHNHIIKEKKRTANLFTRGKFEPVLGMKRTVIEKFTD